MNNPLAAIANYASGCVRRLDGKRINKRGLADALESIVGQATRASETIRRLRGFLRKRESLQAFVDPNQLVDEAAQLVGPEIRRNRVRLLFERETALPGVLADPVQVEQVLVNLLLNGVEAMQECDPERRVLTVGTGVDSGNTVVFSVRDMGRGLEEDFETCIFEPFYTTKTKGLGMGLSISRSIVEAHGGRLWAAPNRPRGATFRFSLPARSGPPS